MKFTRKWVFLTVFILFTVQIVSIYTNEEEFELTEAEQNAVDAHYVMMDSILQDLLLKYDDIKANEFWHPYDFGTGSENREVIHLSSTAQRHIPGKFIQWKMAKFGLQQYLVGMSPNSIKIFNSKFEELTSLDMSSTLDTMEIIMKWDSVSLKPNMILMAATSEPSLVVFRLTDEPSLVKIGSLPLDSPVNSVKICEVENSEKVVLLPRNNESPINIYNIKITDEGVQMWVFQRIANSNFRSVLTHRPDTANSMLIVAAASQLNIYKVTGDPGQFSVHQTLPLTNDAGEEATCSELFDFTLMYQHYIGCMMDKPKTDGSSVTSVEKEVHFLNYNYNMQEYEDKRFFKAVTAMEMYPVRIEGTRDDLLFLAKSEKITETPSIITNILSFDGQNSFRINQECTLDACRDLASFSNGVHFSFEDTDTFVFPTATGQESAPVISFFTEVLTRSSPVFDQSIDLYGEFKRLSDQMNHWRHIVTKADETLAHRLNPNGDNFVTGSWTVNSISTDNVTVKELKGRDTNSDGVFHSLKFGDVDFTEEDFKSSSDAIEKKLDIMDANIEFITNKLDDALLNDAIGQQTVSANILMKGNVIAHNVVANTIEASTLDGQNIETFFHSLANKQDGVINVNGDLVFTNHLNLGKAESRKINGVAVDDFAVLTEDNVFRCSSVFKNIEALDDVQTANVNGRNLAESVVMAHEITGFHFMDGIVAYSSAETDEKYPFDQILLRSVPQNVTSHFILESAKINAPFMVDFVNGKGLEQFIATVIMRNHRGKITGKKTFKDAANLTTLFVSRKWNGLQFPTDFYSVNEPQILLGGQKSFDKIKVSNVIVDKTVDGIETSDLVSLSEPEKIDSTWTFTTDKAEILNDIFVKNTVDGVLMESLIHRGLFNVKEKLFEPNANVIFQSPVQLESFSLEATLNDRTFNEIFDDLIKFDNKAECRVPGKTSILCDTKFFNMNLFDNKINGFSIQNFLTKDIPQTINKPVTFTGSSSFKEIYALESFDGVMVKDLLDRALRVSSATTTMIPWDIHFDEIECQSGLEVHGPINGLANYGRNVARTKGLSTQSFLGQIAVENPIFTNITTEQLHLDPGRTLQTLDIDAWSKTRAKLSEAATFTQPFHISNVLVHQNMACNTVNGVDVKEYQEKVLRSDKQFQEFIGPITINQGVNVFKGNIQFKNTIVDNFKLNDFISHGFPLNLDNKDPIVISEHWEFDSLKLVNDLKIAGPVCGVDLDSLQSDSVKRTDINIEVSGKKVFTQSLEIARSLKSPQINGKSMDNIFHLDTEQEVSGNAKFSGNVYKNVLNAKSINGLMMDQLSELYTFQNGHHTINHDVHVKDTLNSNSITVEGKIQSRNFEEFLANSWNIADTDIIFSDKVTMNQPVTLEEDLNTQFYNGINMNDFKNNVVILNENIQVPQLVSFTNIEATNITLANGDLHTNHLNNGVHWDDVISKSIRINNNNGDILLNNVELTNAVASSTVTLTHLNGISFDKYVLLNTEQDVGMLNIVTAYFNSSNVNINGNMGEFDISDEFDDTLMNNVKGPQKVSGSVLMKGPMHITENLNCFGEDLKHQVVSTREDIVLSGPVEFKDPVVVRKDVSVEKPINNQTVESIFRNTFSTGGGTQKISNLWKFEGPVIFKENISGKGLEDAVDIKGLIDQKEEELRIAGRKVADRKETFLKKCNQLQRIQMEMGTYPVKLDSFEVHQVIGLKQEARHVLVAGRGSNPLILVQSTSCLTSIYKWTPTEDVFIEDETVSSPILGNIDSWQSLSISEDDERSLVVLSQSQSACSTQSGLFYFTTSSTGQISELSLISSENVKSFKMAKAKRADATHKVVLVALFENREHDIDILQWTDLNEFTSIGSMHFDDSPMERVDITMTRKGLGIMSQSRDGIQMFEYLTEAGNLGVLKLGRRSMHPSQSGPMTMFENFNYKYAVVLESDTTPAMIQPTCNFEVIRFSEKTAEPIQKLQVPEVISATQFTFSNQEYLVFLSKSHGLYIYKFMGLNGFQLMHNAPYKVFDGLMLDSFYVKQEGFEFPHPFVLTLSQNRMEIYRGNVIGDRLTGEFTNLCDIKAN